MGAFLRGLALGVPAAFVLVLSLLRLTADGGPAAEEGGADGVPAGTGSEAVDPPVAAAPATEANGGDPTTAAAAPVNSGGVSNAELEKLRETLKAQPDVIPEMIEGASVAELTAANERAKAAHAAAADRLNASVKVANGAGNRGAGIDITKLSPKAKIITGLGQRS